MEMGMVFPKRLFRNRAESDWTFAKLLGELSMRLARSTHAAPGNAGRLGLRAWCASRIARSEGEPFAQASFSSVACLPAIRIGL